MPYAGYKNLTVEVNTYNTLMREAKARKISGRDIVRILLDERQALIAAKEQAESALILTFASFGVIMTPASNAPEEIKQQWPALQKELGQIFFTAVQVLGKNPEIAKELIAKYPAAMDLALSKITKAMELKSR
jgi:hypothetical protein